MSYIVSVPLRTLIPQTGVGRRVRPRIARLCSHGLLTVSFLFLIMPVALGQGLPLSGKVILEDGSPPPERVRIELVCDHQVYPQAYSQSDGGFSFRVGGNQAQEMVHAKSTASPGPSPSRTSSGLDLSHCEVRAALEGYRSSQIQLGRRASSRENPDIGVITLYREGEGQGPLVSLSTLKSPESALEAYQKGKEELTKEKPNPKKASKELQKAIKEYPEFAAAWNLLAEARIQMDDVEGAREALKKAVETDPNFATPCITLALLELKQGNVAEAEAASAKAIQLMPEHPDARYYHGMATANLGDLVKAEESLRVVLGSLEVFRFPRAHYLLGNVLAQQGQVEEAASQYHRYLELEPDSRAAVVARKQLKEWKSSGLIH